MVSKKMKSELCKTCIHTKVCMHDKNLIGDVFVMGHPMFFDNDKLYEEYKERERQGFPCEDYISSAQPKKGEWIDALDEDPCYYRCSECGRLSNFLENFCPECGADMRGEEE